MLEKEGPSTIILAMQKENQGKIALVKNKKKKMKRKLNVSNDFAFETIEKWINETKLS